ncbi:MAG TPA: adenylate/guanylate cyclase domain-containing protein [Mycobacterium sp.]|nr:adenylate/guanylate cyclase domain-containing protein [Mycobacterium sp.]
MTPGESGASIDELLDRAVRAINEGDRATAATLAGQVLSVDRGNPDAEDLLTAPSRYGEIRRLTIMFADLVDSTALSTRLEPETYRTLVGRYREEVRRIIDRYEGHISSIKGDGLLAVFGHPKAHEDDVRRAVAAGLDITAAVAQLSGHAERKLGVAVNVRVGIHRGLVYLDTKQDDVYGFAANLAARLCGVAEPGRVAVSDAVAPLVGNSFELDTRAPVAVKGVEAPISAHQVVAEWPAALPLRPPPLVGRDRERSWLQQSWQQAREGALNTPGVVFCGEPGIGKTRLATEAAEIVEGAGGTVIELRGSPLHIDTGLHPVRRLLERRCGITRLTDGAERLQLLELELRSCAMDPVSTVPLIAPVLGIGPEHGYQPAAVEGHTLYDLIGETVRRYVLACLHNQPGLVIAEDVHWFDPSTRELLNSILAAADGQLMVVVTGREGDWLQNDWPAKVFALEPLTDELSEALIEALDPTVSDAQRTAVRQRCDGVPFYIEHVVAGLDGHAPVVPEALYEPLFARLHTHSDVVPVVEAAAVIGRAGDLPLLRAVVGPDGQDVDEVITELVRAHVFERRGADGWRFRHELLREVALELAPPSQRRDLHARAAHALADTTTAVEPEWRVVASHFEQAQQYDEAVAAYQKASVNARRRGAIAEARTDLTNAVNLLPQCAAGPQRDRREIAIRLERGFLAVAVAVEGSVSGEGPAEFERCLQLASDGMHERELLLTLTAMISYYYGQAELRRLHELLDSLSNRIPRDWLWSYPAIASSLGAIAWLEGDFAAACKHLLRALTDRSAADPHELDAAWWILDDPIAVTHVFLALTAAVGGDLGRADAELAESVRRCHDLGGFPQNAHNRAHSYFMEIWVRLESGQHSEAADLAAELRRLSEQTGLDLWQAVGATQRATVKGLAALSAGDDATTLIAKAERIAMWVDGSRLMHLNVYLTFHDAIIGRLLVAAGEPERARQRLEMALRHAEETGMHFYDAELMRVRAHTFTDPQERRDALAAALELTRHQGAVLFELRCLLDLFDMAGDGDSSGLADVVGRLPGDAGWPELARAQRILS